VVRGRTKVPALLALAVLCLTGLVQLVAAWPGAAADPAPTPPPASGVSAGFKFDPKNPAGGDKVTFDSTSEVWGDGNQIVSYEWDLDGNGTFEAGGPTVTRTYPSRRSIDVKLRVTDASQPPQTDVETHRVTISNRPPVASFTWSPVVPGPNEGVAFTSTATDSDGAVVAQAWDLDGDGKFDNGGGPTALRSFSAPGTYLIGLRVVDNDGSASVISVPVVVAPGPSPGLLASQQGGIRLMNPFPIVRIAGRYLSNGARIKLLVVDAPRGAKVSIRCRGRGCPFRKQVRPASLVRIKKLERVLRAGAVVKVYVTQRDRIGKYTRVKIRAGKAPARIDMCLAPNSWRPVHCPGL
jgi:PKD domain-containing protein